MAANECEKWTHFPRPKVPAIGWTNFTSVDVFNSAQIEILPGICTDYDCRPGDSDCESEKNGEKNYFRILIFSMTFAVKSPPILVECPKSQQIYVPDAQRRLVTVNWDGKIK
jgi:hypothetical protein